MNLVLFVISILTWNSITVSCQRQDVHHMLYESFPSAVSCFRLLNGTHQFGCSSDPSGSLGVIHVIKAQSDVDWLFSDDAVAGPYMAVVSPQIFASEEIMNKLRTSSIVSGILLAVNGPTDRPDQMSPDDTCPNRYSGLPGTCNNKWNPYGLSYHLQDWGKPVFYVNDMEVISKVHECYKKFNLPLNQSQLTKNLCSLQMKGHMYAAVDTPTCIERSRSFSYLNPLIYCDPMGDRNIFTSLFPLKNVKEKSLIVVTTHLDGATMFDNLAPAAMSTATGIVTIMAAARVLSKMLPYNDNYSKNVIFIMFSGESYDYIGSSRAVYDIIKKKFPTKARSIDFEQIGYMFEVNQLDKSRDLFFHDNDTDSQADSLSYKFKTAFTQYAKENKFTLTNKKDGSVLPPSSVQSFLKEYPKLPFSVLTNYETQFKNRFYSSLFDNSSNIDYKYYNGSNNIPADSVQATLADLAIILAKTLYKLITDKDYTEKSDYVDPQFMDDLLHCYLDTRQCQIFKDTFPYDRTPLEPSSVYVGVARSSNIIVTLTHSSLAYFTGNRTDKSSKDNCLEANLSDDDYDYIWITGKSGHGECYKSFSRFTTAVSPAFEIDDYDWSSGKYSTWSESVWQELNLRMFLKPSRQQEYLTLTLGLFIIIFSFSTVYWIKSRASILFHTKPGVVC